MDSSIRSYTLTSQNDLPLVVEPSTDRAGAAANFVHWVAANRAWLDDTLLKHGAILFRGFEIDSPKTLREILIASGHEPRAYVEGQSERQRVSEKIYTSTEYPAKYDITLHSELSYSQSPPRRIFFYCDVAPTEGGETPIADCRRVYQNLDPTIRDRFETDKICYVKNMHGGSGLGKSWQAHFETPDRSVVESYLNAGNVQFEWRNDGGLRTRQVRPATIEHPITRERTWFNQADLWHYTNLGEYGQDMFSLLGEEGLATNAYYGAGSPISPEHLAIIRKQSLAEATIFRWQKGDLLVLDNLLVSHGRLAFAGERRILVAMS